MPDWYVTDPVHIHFWTHARAPFCTHAPARLRRLLLLSESGEGARVLPDSHRKETNRDPWLIVRIYPGDFNSFRILSLSLCPSSSRSGSDQRRAQCLWMAAAAARGLRRWNRLIPFLCELLRFDAGAAAAFGGGGDPGTSSASPCAGTVNLCRKYNQRALWSRTFRPAQGVKRSDCGNRCPLRPCGDLKVVVNAKHARNRISPHPSES